MTHVLQKIMANIKTSQFSRNISQFGIHNVQFSRSYSNRELVRASVTQDILMQNLKTASNTRYILDLISSHNNIMNNKHIIQALRTLFTLQKSGKSNLSTYDLLENRDFKQLCRNLRKQAPSIDLSETIEALKVISYVGVQSDTVLVQVLLQLIRHHINHLNLQQIIFLDFLLSQFSSTPLVEALKMALPMVFEIQLPIKMDHENISHLAEYLFFASRHSLSHESMELITKYIKVCSEGIDAKTAKSIIWSICDLDNNDVYEPLMRAALNSYMVHWDSFNYNDIETTLSKMVYRFSPRRAPYFYDDVFFDSCSNHVIDHDLGFKHALYILRKFSRIGHVNNRLLDYASEKMLENPDLIKKAGAADICAFIVSTALTSYRPNGWPQLKEYLSKVGNLVEHDTREIIWIKLASSMCLLDIYKLDILAKCLNEPFLDNMFKKPFKSNFDNFITVWQCIKMKKPELSDLLPSKYAPENLIRTFRLKLQFPMEGALQKGLGGEKYVITDVFSRMGQRIDHVILLRKGGYPIALTDYQHLEFIEDIRVCPATQIVLIIGLTPVHFILNNNKQLKYSAIYSMQVLESQGYITVPISLQTWDVLQDFEKIPYLMRAIKEKVDSDVNVSEVLV